MNILRRVPASILYMMAESAVVRDNLLGQARYHGIAEGRIRWFDKVSLLCTCAVVFDILYTVILVVCMYSVV